MLSTDSSQGLYNALWHEYTINDPDGRTLCDLWHIPVVAPFLLVPINPPRSRLFRALSKLSLAVVVTDDQDNFALGSKFVFDDLDMTRCSVCHFERRSGHGFQ